jgi:CDP-glucose 4,6-dehydratase
MATPSFWRGKRVFLTGHTGFKGSWLSLWLTRMGAEVTGFALAPPSQPSLFEKAEIASRVHSLTGDVRDLAALKKAVAEAKPEIVIHMAAQALVRLSYREPVETYATNVMGTVHLLEAVRATPSVRAALVVTSDKCYENREWVWGYRENEPMGGHDPYSNSKGCAELVTAAYRSSFFSAAAGAGVASIASARAGNVIGGGDWAEDRLIPDCVRALLKGAPIQVRNPHSIRPWQHVLEPLSGYLALAEAMFTETSGTGGRRYAEGWNFGPELSDARPVNWIADRMVERWGRGARWERVGGSADGKPEPHEAHYLKLDCSKAHAELNWTPRLRLDQTLDWIVDWYQKVQAGESALSVTLQQIERYESLAKLS